MTRFSVLDLAPVTEGSTASEALQHSLDLAQHAENWGYTRYWIAEHHNIPGIASSATAVVIGHIAGGTSTIRVGAGGIMLPNHAPLIVAEQFGTLASLYPDRIDLGLGRAPGTDQMTWQALRRNASPDIGDFPRDVVELQHYLKDPQEGQKVIATPGAGTDVPIWILGSSLFGAQLAAMLGLPFAFASHFAPAAMDQAIALYREKFEPSDQLQEPYVMLGLQRLCGGIGGRSRPAAHLIPAIFRQPQTRRTRQTAAARRGLRGRPVGSGTGHGAGAVPLCRSRQPESHQAADGGISRGNPGR